MPRARVLHVAGVLAGIASTLTLTAGTSQAAAHHDASPVVEPGVDSVVPTSPTNAAKIFQWGLSDWEDEFIDPLSTVKWAVSDDSLVRNQNGMLTMEGTATSGRVTALQAEHPRRYGRWEARVRSNVEDKGGTPYRVFWELVPARRGDSCGDGITLATYAVDDPVARMDIRGRAGEAFTEEKPLDLEQYAWHTYAVEVTPDHISWFVDTKVIMTERRPEALAGNPFRMRFRLEPVEGARMDFTRMQMDWARYYTLQRPGALPIDAPAAKPVDFTAGC